MHILPPLYLFILQNMLCCDALSKGLSGIAKIFAFSITFPPSRKDNAQYSNTIKAECVMIQKYNIKRECVTQSLHHQV